MPESFYAVTVFGHDDGAVQFASESVYHSFGHGNGCFADGQQINAMEAIEIQRCSPQVFPDGTPRISGAQSSAEDAESVLS
jgi:hypothetical protein